VIETDRIAAALDTRPGHEVKVIKTVYAGTGTVYYPDGRVHYAGPLKVMLAYDSAGERELVLPPTMRAYLLLNS
jgi:hypothetical protein